MSVATVSRQVRAILLESTDAPALPELFQTVESFVLDCSSAEEPNALLQHLEYDLHTIHDEIVDHNSLRQTEIFLSVLHHLRPVLSSTSIITTWFDLVLRPALREPKLPTIAVEHAKGLIVCALESSNLEKVGEFRRRLLDLYLLDVFNEGSGEDILEWADLDQDQKDKKTHWKLNLEDTLIKFGLERPSDFLTVANDCFLTPSSRLQILMLLNLFTSRREFQKLAGALATHSLMTGLIYSLLLDNSSTVCITGLTILVKLLPILAVHGTENLKRLLPQFLAILVRVICWKERPLSNLRSSASSTCQLDDVPPEAEAALDKELMDDRPLHIRSDLAWERLEMTFDATASSAPSPRALFTIIYYLFPRNVLRFLREPVNYLEEYGISSPYTTTWEDALDESKIRSKSEALIRGHVLHPLIIWRDTSTEMSQPDFWVPYDVSRIASECMMLDVRNAAIGIRELHLEDVPSMSSTRDIPQVKREDMHDVVFSPDEFAPTPHPPHAALSTVPERPRISLQDMIYTSVALKSNLDVDVTKPSMSWPSGLFPTATSSPSKQSISLPPESESSSLLHADSMQSDAYSQDHDQQIPYHVAQALSGLQREVLLLRNELNFELWLSRENVKHIGRLYQDRIISKTAEAERQGLYNKLRKYKAQVLGLERQLKEHKEHASSAKHKYADWNTELQKKLHGFREEKKSWIAEAAALRSAEKEAQDRFDAQGQLLADANRDLFDLQTQKKENKPKIDRLRDYEHQIEQHLKMQRMWDNDFQIFKDRGEEVMLVKNKYRQMEMRLESYKKTQEQMEEQARGYRRQIQALEARLALANKKGGTSRQMPAEELAAFVVEKSTLNKSNEKLRGDNAELKEEVEEMRAMLEMLKAQVSGRRGLISARSSPVMFASGI